MRGGRKEQKMKRVAMQQVFQPRMGWDRDYRGECVDGRWGEYVDGDKPAAGELPDGAVRIKGGFKWGQGAIAVKDGRIVGVAVANECTWWDDPDTGATYAPDDGETIVVVGFSSEPDFMDRKVCDDHESSYDPEERGDTLASPYNWNSWPAAELRRIGAWRDADDRKAEAVREIKAAKKAAYDNLVAEANKTWGRYADRLLSAHLASGWTRESGVQDAVFELIKAPNVVRRLKKLPGGCVMVSVLEREFKAPQGHDILKEALESLSGPRMDRAVAVAACILGI